MKLSKSFQQNDRKGFSESELILTVEYNRQDTTVTDIIAVEVVNLKTGKLTDITAIMWEQFEEQLDGMIEKIDWQEIYLEKIESYAGTAVETD